MRDKEELFEAEYSTSRRRTRKSGEGASRDSKPGVSTDPDLKPVEVMPHQARAQIKRNLASQNVGYEGVPAKKAIRKSIERHRRKKRVVESIYNAYCDLGSLINEMGPEAREYRRYQRMAQRQAGTNQTSQADQNFKRAEKVYDRIPRKWSREMARSKQALKRLPKDAPQLKPAGSPSGRRERRFDRDVAHLADDPKNVKLDFKNN